MGEEWRDSAARAGAAAGVAFWVATGDVALLDVDVVVNAANDRGWMGAGVAGAIKRAGGEGIEADAMRGAPGRPGTAWTTGAGALQARHVVHAAAMGQDLLTSAPLIEAATAAAVVCARDVGAATVAFPVLGTGVGGFDLREAARLMARVLATEVVADPGALTDVVFAVFDPGAAAGVDAAVRAVLDSVAIGGEAS